MKRDRHQASAGRGFHGEACITFAENVEAGRFASLHETGSVGSEQTTVDERFSSASISSFSAINEEESKFTEALQNVCVAIAITRTFGKMIPWIEASPVMLVTRGVNVDVTMPMAAEDIS